MFDGPRVSEQPGERERKGMAVEDVAEDGNFFTLSSLSLSASSDVVSLSLSLAVFPFHYGIVCFAFVPPGE